MVKDSSNLEKNNLNVRFGDKFQTSDFFDMLTKDFDQINEFILKADWTLTDHEKTSEINTVTWTSKNEEHSIILEYGEGYDNSIILKTTDKQEYELIFNGIDWSNFEEKYDKKEASAIHKGFFGKEDDLAILFKQPTTNNQPNLLVFTTLSNVDAIWFESEYLN